ncbi:ATP-binding protein [Streptomyces sp. NPDC058257]|uniref:ATP-binding protein n=1 Tax=Streptomyces sp. NPDC058257 TaxID=3346409 RepID=UPI0036F13090
MADHSAHSTPYEVSFRLPRHRRSVPRSRALLHAVLGGWSIDEDTTGTAELLLSELVTNALRARAPEGGQVGVRLARSEEEGLLRVEVSDAGEGRPEVRAPGEDETRGRGLLLVEALAHRWGVWAGEGGMGKTVWAELKSPDIVPEPAGTEMAAITVRAGQRVRVWGAWRTVLSVRRVRSERYPAGGPTVILGLDEGPPLRVSSAEPLTVQTVSGEAAGPR